jgi:tripartite-type tricarboxylate transporter receptor subunit TctC
MQLAAMTFVTMADLKINLVPYRGTAPAVTDAIAGHVQLAIADPPPSMAAIGEGRLKAVAVTSKQRFPVFPDVPTFQELGLKDFELTGWFGIVAPGGTPREIVAKLSDAMVTALNDPEVVRRIRTVGMEPTPTTPAEFSAYLDAEIAKAEKLQNWSDKPN